MKTVFKRTIAGFIAGSFSGTISVAIMSYIIGLNHGVPFGAICCGAFLFMSFGGPIGACIGTIVGVFISMTDYTDAVKFKWGIVAGLGAALGAVLVVDAPLEMWITIVLTSAISGEFVARCIAALFIEGDAEPGTRRAWTSYVASSLLIAVAVNRYLEWWILVISEID